MSDLQVRDENEIDKTFREMISSQNEEVIQEVLLLKRWVGEKQALKTKLSYSRVVNDFLKFTKYKSLKNITVDEVSNFIFVFYEEMSLSTKANAKDVLSSLYSFLVNCGYVTKNPAKLVSNIKVPKEIASKVLSKEEVDRLILKAKSKRDSLIIKTLYFTGLRVSELSNIKWSDIKEKKSFYIVSVIGKGSKARTVNFKKDLYDELLEIKRKKAIYLFESNRGKFNPDSISRIIRELSQKVLLRSISAHNLRHTHVTHALEKNCPIHVVQQSAGHSSMATTGKYAHITGNRFSGDYL